MIVCGTRDGHPDGSAIDYGARMGDRGVTRTRIRAWTVRLGRSFQFATRGMWIARSDPNIRIELVCAAAVIFLTVAYGMTGAHLGVVVLSITTVLAAEVMNTAIERTCDLIAQLHGIGLDSRIRDIKDLAAGSVLIISIGALANGIILFGPLLL
jgi:diacylglycerol kinase